MDADTSLAVEVTVSNNNLMASNGICWRESVRPLQYYCRTLPMLHLVNQTKLLFWKKMYTNSNIVLYTLSRYAGVPSRFMAVASQYGMHSLRQTVGTVKFAVWKFFYRDCSYIDVLILS